MIIKLLTEQHLECLSLKVGCIGSSESTLVKISNCWKSHAAARMNYQVGIQDIYLQVKLGDITSVFQWYTIGISLVSNGITSGLHSPVIVVSIGIPVVSRIWCYYQWFPVV